MAVMVGFVKTHTHDTNFEDLNETDISTFVGPSSPPGTWHFSKSVHCLLMKEEYCKWIHLPISD
jgi:hypothetical protein